MIGLAFYVTVELKNFVKFWHIFVFKIDMGESFLFYSSRLKSVQSVITSVCALVIANSSENAKTSFFTCNLNSICLSIHMFVCLSDTRVDESKTVQARITKFSPSAVWKTLVSETVKLFHKFGGAH